ncbi:MAG TPA: AAA family ATPase, partial [Anaerolineales bacterium]|nr:AAA family ATPase [Anaerolineales bacterium]
MTEPDLFDHALQERMAVEAPLAARMRPRSLEEFVGQREIIGRGRLLRRAIEADKLFSSILLWGPPGSGKTTLANIIANSTASYFTTLSAVLAGVRELRAVIAAALERRKLHGVRTILFVDEVHRWNKAQQDALLPHVERGVIVLIGATTENPYFEVIGALVSRSRVFQFRALSDDDTRRVLQETLKDSERGYGGGGDDKPQGRRADLGGVGGGGPRATPPHPWTARGGTPPPPPGAARREDG